MKKYGVYYLNNGKEVLVRECFSEDEAILTTDVINSNTIRSHYYKEIKSNQLKAKIKYFDKAMLKLEHVGGNEKSCWIDVRASRIKINGKLADWSEDGLISYKKGQTVQIYLGFAMELPTGYEAYTLPRSSTYKNYSLIQVNSQGIVDESYCGDNDEWFIPFVAMKSGNIGKHERIGQFRIQEKMPEILFEEVETLGNDDRGGFGSTGTK